MPSIVAVAGKSPMALAKEAIHEAGRAHAETARELAYRLYTVCERRKRAAEALAYNGLVQSWPEIARLAQQNGEKQPTPADMLEQL